MTLPPVPTTPPDWSGEPPVVYSDELVSRLEAEGAIPAVLSRDTLDALIRVAREAIDAGGTFFKLTPRTMLELARGYREMQFGSRFTDEESYGSGRVVCRNSIATLDTNSPQGA